MQGKLYDLSKSPAHKKPTKKKQEVALSPELLTGRQLQAQSADLVLGLPLSLLENETGAYSKFGSVGNPSYGVYRCVGVCMYVRT